MGGGGIAIRGEGRARREEIRVGDAGEEKPLVLSCLSELRERDEGDSLPRGTNESISVVPHGGVTWHSRRRSCQVWPTRQGGSCCLYSVLIHVWRRK